METKIGTGKDIKERPRILRNCYEMATDSVVSNRAGQAVRSQFKYSADWMASSDYILLSQREVFQLRGVLLAEKRRS
jgi:hypothetical protein